MTNLAHRFAVAMAALAGAMLAGCATQYGAPDDSMGSYMVSPGKYQLYSCAQMAELAYRAEYLQPRGELAELGRATAAKNCPPPEVEEAPPKIPPKGRPARR